MPELPDIVVYCECLEQRLQGQVVHEVRIDNPFVLRTAVPPLSELHGATVRQVHRLGKRIVLSFDDKLYLVIHLMIAGRLNWESNTQSVAKPTAKPTAEPTDKPVGKSAAKAAALPKRAKAPRRGSLAQLVTEAGVLKLIEAGTTRRASIHLVQGQEALDGLHRGGLEVLEATRQAFVARVTEQNRTLKRVLTDPAILSGIGNAYSDEILHRAGLSPMLQSQRATAAQLASLFDATRAVLNEWTDRLREQVAQSQSGFPEKVTAFHEEMAVHGRFGKPCPVCASPIQRIRYASNETNYCARCQNDGVILKDRSLSRLLKDSWPRSLDD